VTVYDPTEWSDLFVATAGAAAALAGLVFVAVSINLDRILKLEGLPDRALETVMLLVGALVISVIGLIPGQSHHALGGELLVFTVLLGVFLARLPVIHTTAGVEPPGGVWARWVIRVGGSVLMMAGSISILLAVGGGLYWIVAGILFAIIGAVANAWVLLVEIWR
jgi:modulator of FtsH protease